MKNLIALVLTLIVSASVANAATYYVDFEGGDNEADGLSPRTAWKHSPGDSNATGKPSTVELEPGDIIRFKGGVQYLGEIALTVSGSEGKPIVLDGNTDGAFGEGRAVLDGARMITQWQSVSSAAEVGRNPNWRNILYADLDTDLSSNFNPGRFVLHRDTNRDRQAPWQRIFLVDGERRVLPVAQRPKPSDPFYPDLPGDFYESPDRLSDSYPHKVYYEEGSRGNRSLPLIAITYGGSAPVIEPFNGGEVSVEMKAPAPIAEIGFMLFRPESVPVPEHIVFFADGKEILKAEVDPEQAEMQRFKLPETVKAGKLTFQLRHSGEDVPRWTKLRQIAAFTPDGENVIEHEISTVVRDEKRLTREDADWYDGMFVGVHGGNNHVYFAPVKRYDPQAHELHVPHFQSTTYKTTRYALFNSPKLIDQPGEWSLAPIEGGRTRVFFWPERTQDGQPQNIGYPARSTGITLSGDASHVEVRGFVIQRYSGGYGGVATRGRGGSRPSHIRIADCEVRFLSGQSGITLNHSDHIEVENCYVHHCPGWTVGTYVNRVNHYRLINNRLDKNSGSGIRHYESKHGVLRGNVVLNHYGMHSSALNFYEGCADILFENNYVQRVIAINRSAEDITFRNNVVDGQKGSAFNVAMWRSGRTGGTFIRDIVFENNTFINTNPEIGYATSIFAQSGPSVPEGLVIRNNVLDRLRPPVPGTVEGNIFMRETDAEVAGSDSMMASDPDVLFRDPEDGDYRRKPDGPMMEAGADVPPAPAEWQR